MEMRERERKQTLNDISKANQRARDSRNGRIRKESDKRVNKNYRLIVIKNKSGTKKVGLVVGKRPLETDL